MSGLSYNTYLNKYMSIGTKGLPDAAGPAGVYYSLSDDLRDWSERKLIIKTETNSTFDAAYTARGGPQVPVDLCDLDDPISHPVILDPSDPAEAQIRRSTRTDGETSTTLGVIRTSISGSPTPTPITAPRTHAATPPQTVT